MTPLPCSLHLYRGGLQGGINFSINDVCAVGEEKFVTAGDTLHLSAVAWAVRCHARGPYRGCFTCAADNVKVWSIAVAPPS